MVWAPRDLKIEVLQQKKNKKNVFFYFFLPGRRMSRRLRNKELFSFAKYVRIFSVAAFADMAVGYGTSMRLVLQRH